MSVHLIDHRGHERGIKASTIRSRAARILQALGLQERELSLVLCDDDEIHLLNRQWRKKDKPTDVLSFPQDGEEMLGDVVISIETAERQSRDEDGWARAHALRNAPGTSWGTLEETTLLLIHGVLHLLGHDHHKAAEAKVMRAEEARLYALLDRRAKPAARTLASKEAPARRASKTTSTTTTKTRPTAKKAAPTKATTARKAGATKAAAPKEAPARRASKTKTAAAPQKKKAASTPARAKAAKPATTPKTAAATKPSARKPSPRKAKAKPKAASQAAKPKRTPSTSARKPAPQPAKTKPDAAPTKAPTRSKAAPKKAETPGRSPKKKAVTRKAAPKRS